MSEVLVKLSLVDTTKERMTGLARELKELSLAAKNSGMPDASKMAQGARQLQNVADNFGNIRKEAKQTSDVLSQAKDAMGAFTSSAGLGLGKSLLGLGGAVAFAAAAGKIIADSIKLAVEFERVSQRATFSLALGQGNLVAQLNAMKSAAGGYAGLGIDKIQSAEMMGTYGQAAGATVRQSINAGDSLAKYSRGFGMDPVQLAAQMGLLAQYAGKDNGKNSSEFFGAARSAGDAGRRPTELLGQTVNLLSQMQASNPMGNIGLKSALSEIVGVTKMGGYFQTQQGIQSVTGGYNTIGHAVSSNPALTNLAMRSGWSTTDIMFGSSDPKKLNPLLTNLYKQTGGNANILASVVQSILPGDQGRDVFTALMKNHGKISGDFTALSKKDLKAADDAYEKTPEGQMAKAAAEIKNAEIGIGDAIVKFIAPKLATVAEDLNKLATGLTNMHFPTSMGEVADGLKAVAAGLIATLPQDKQAYLRQASSGADKVLGWGQNIWNAVTHPRDTLNSIDQNISDSVTSHWGGASDQVAGRADAAFDRSLSNGGIKSPWDTKRLLYAIRKQESSTTAGAYQMRGSIDIPEMGGRAVGAYQFMPSTLEGYAKSMDPALLKKLGLQGFIQYYMAHPKMQDRYEGNMLENAKAAGVSNPLEYGVYHLSGGGDVAHHTGFAWWKYKRTHHLGGRDSADGNGTTQTREGLNMLANYDAAPMSARSRFIADHNSAAQKNANHPAHANSGGGAHKSTHHVASNGHSIKVTVEASKNSNRTVATTSR